MNLTYHRGQPKSDSVPSLRDQISHFWPPWMTANACDAEPSSVTKYSPFAMRVGTRSILTISSRISAAKIRPIAEANGAALIACIDSLAWSTMATDAAHAKVRSEAPGPARNALLAKERHKAEHIACDTTEHNLEVWPNDKRSHGAT